MARHKTSKPPLPPDAQVGEQVDERSDAAPATGGGTDAPARVKAGVPQKTDAAKAKDAVAPNDYSDLIFGGSFVGAALFGVANAINTLRHGFYESFVKPNTAIITGGPEKRNLHPFADIFQDRHKEFESLSLKYKSGDIDGKTYRAEKLKAVKLSGELIEQRMVNDMGIHTRGVRGWTVDLWKQRQHTGVGTRRNALFTMATTSVVTLGAIATLKYTKHLLDRIDDNEKQLNDAKQQALLTEKSFQPIPTTVVSEVAQTEKLQHPAERAASL